MKQEKIKLVIFDGEGVIYDSKEAMKVFLKSYKEFLKKFNVSFKEQERLWFQLYPKIVRGKIKLKEANALIYKKLGIPKKYVKEWLSRDLSLNLKYTKVYPGIKTLMRKIKSKGIKIAILSDTVHPLAWRLKLFKKLGLIKGKHYDKGFLSWLKGKNPVFHVHVVLGSSDFSTISGHLKSAKVNATLEMFILKSPIKLIKIKDEKTGLKLLEGVE